MSHSPPIIQSFLYYSSEEKTFLDDRSILLEIEHLPYFKGEKSLYGLIRGCFVEENEIEELQQSITGIVTQRLKKHRFVHIIIDGEADDNIKESLSRIDETISTNILIHHISQSHQPPQPWEVKLHTLCTYPNFYLFYKSNVANFLRSFQYARINTLIQSSGNL